MAVKGFKAAMMVGGLVILAGIIFSCKQETSKQDVLPKQEVVKYLLEVYLAESKINQLSLTSDSARRIFKIMMPKIREKTGVSDTLVRRSLDYYADRPQDLQQIYTALVDSLNLREQRAKAKD